MAGGSQFIDGGVGGNPVNPGGQFGLAFKALKAPVDFGKYFLRGVFGFIRPDETRKVI